MIKLAVALLLISTASYSQTPLIDLGTGTYLGFPGGLYENGSNTVPVDHEADGLMFASQIQPLDTNGNSSPNGKIVLLGIGMSNVMTEFKEFCSEIASDPAVNPKVVCVDGANSGFTACGWSVAHGPVYPTCPSGGTTNYYDWVVTNVLTPKGLTEAQVQVVWWKDADAFPFKIGLKSLCDPTIPGCVNTFSAPANGHQPTGTDALVLEFYEGGMARATRVRYANLKLLFPASRIWGGYDTTGRSPEPPAYEGGFSTKWTIEAQVTEHRGGAVDPVAGNLDYPSTAAWMAWGGYLWADGATPRSDGLQWCNGQLGNCSPDDFGADGVHPGTHGNIKVAGQLKAFFKGSELTFPWFCVSGVAC